MHLRHQTRVFQLQHRLPQHAAADDQQQQAQGQRSPGFKALMTVRVVLIRGFLALVIRHQNHKISHQVRQSMNPVSHQGLGSGHHAHDHLQGAQNQVDGHAHPGALLGRCDARRCAFLGVVRKIAG